VKSFNQKHPKRFIVPCLTVEYEWVAKDYQPCLESLNRIETKTNREKVRGRDKAEEKQQQQQKTPKNKTLITSER